MGPMCEICGSIPYSVRACHHCADQDLINVLEELGPEVMRLRADVKRLQIALGGLLHNVAMEDSGWVDNAWLTLNDMGAKKK